MFEITDRSFNFVGPHFAIFLQRSLQLVGLNVIIITYFYLVYYNIDDYSNQLPSLLKLSGFQVQPQNRRLRSFPSCNKP